MAAFPNGQETSPLHLSMAFEHMARNRLLLFESRTLKAVGRPPLCAKVTVIPLIPVLPPKVKATQLFPPFRYVAPTPLLSMPLVLLGPASVSICPVGPRVLTVPVWARQLLMASALPRWTLLEEVLVTSMKLLGLIIYPTLVLRSLRRPWLTAKDSLRVLFGLRRTCRKFVRPPLQAATSSSMLWTQSRIILLLVCPLAPAIPRWMAVDLPGATIWGATLRLEHLKAAQSKLQLKGHSVLPTCDTPFAGFGPPLLLTREEGP